MLASRLT